MQSISRWFAGFCTAVSLAGCVSGADSSVGEPEAMFPLGSRRSDLVSRISPGKFVRIMEGEPEDRFVAATIYEMVSAGKPRPRAYEIFPTPASDGRGGFWDYVFYNDQERITYVARRRV